MAEMQAKEKGYTLDRGFSEIWHHWRLDRTMERRIENRHSEMYGKEWDMINIIGALCDFEVYIAIDKDSIVGFQAGDCTYRPRHLDTN